MTARRDLRLRAQKDEGSKDERQDKKSCPRATMLLCACARAARVRRINHDDRRHAAKASKCPCRPAANGKRRKNPAIMFIAPVALRFKPRIASQSSNSAGQ